MTKIRTAARVLVFDDEGRLLLLRGTDPARPDAGSWWFTPGGALDAGESPQDAARREVREETGIELGELGPVVLRRTARFTFDGADYEQWEEFFCARTATTELDFSGWTELEGRSLLDARWWSIGELLTTGDVVYPAGLAALAVAVGEGIRRRPAAPDGG